jgi:hypothetical protein
MKKITALVVLCLLWGGVFLFADDASVLPARVGRVYLAPTFAFANGAYDKDGKYQGYGSGEGAMKGFNLGAALEYGILDWITAAVQWAPGWMLASDLDMDVLGADRVNVNGAADLFIGGKFLIVGDNAPVRNSRFRWSLATGVKVPLPGPDYEEQAKNIANKDPVTPANQDKHVLGLGLRTYFDYVINENFYVDLYGEFIGYPVKGKLSKSSLSGYMIAKQIDDLKAAGSIPDELLDYGGVNYGFDLTLELEPVYSLALAGGVVFTAGLPLTYQFSPGGKYDVTVSDAVIGMDPAAAALRLEDDGPSHGLSIKPSAAFFFTGFSLPTEFKLNYAAPLAGNNGMATHSVTLQVKLYFKL